MENWLSGLNGFLGNVGSAYRSTVESESQKKLADAQKKQAAAAQQSSAGWQKVALIGGSLLVGGIIIVAVLRNK